MHHISEMALLNKILSTSQLSYLLSKASGGACTSLFIEFNHDHYRGYN